MEKDICDQIFAHLNWNMKGGTLYLVNSKWEGCNTRPKEMSMSQVKHPSSGSLSCSQCRGNSHCGTPDISDGSSRTVSDSNYPPHTQTQTPTPHIFPPTHNLLLFLWAPQPSLNLQKFLTTLSYIPWLPSPSANVVPNHSSSPSPIMQYSPQH